LVGEPFGVLFMRSGDTCDCTYQHSVQLDDSDSLVDSQLRFSTFWREGADGRYCRCRLATCVGEECLRRMAHAPSRRLGAAMVERRAIKYGSKK
jgi:hypothetical protein